ncbi:dephospho-CoA kinase [Tistrella bauzanensis]|uniref:Dephospho-CoA kinase n=1 Tax=Tistrella arctica TaxID=3133430 RepID=A0ABU9YGS0_9PROT
MQIIGLTGSIGMGKSTTSTMLRRLKVPVFDADATVHQLLAPGGRGFGPVAERFPEAVRDGRIDRVALGARVFGRKAELRALERILHPLVRDAQHHFIATHARRRAPLVVLDIPLLFESGGNRRVDAVLVVSAPNWVQARRVLARPGMTRPKFRDILAKQVPDAEKRRGADAVIQTGLGRAHAFRALTLALDRLAGRPHRMWKSHWQRPRLHHPRSQPPTGARRRPGG